MSSLVISGLSVRYRSTGRLAVRDVALEVKEGTTAAIVGESGSGKSSLGRAIQGLLGDVATVTGAVSFGAEVRKLNDKSGKIGLLGSRRVRYIPQDAGGALNPSKTVGQLMDETLAQIGSKKGRRDRTKAIIETLSSVGIARPDLCIKLYPHELSGGMAQRVVIGDALLAEPAVIIADEPTASLDATTSITILKLLRGLATAHNAAIILITHNIGHASFIGDSIHVMYGGLIVESGPVATVLMEPRMPYTAALLRSRPSVASGHEDLAVIPGMPPPDIELVDGCVFRERCEFADSACVVQPAITGDELNRRSGDESTARSYRCWHPLNASIESRPQKEESDAQ